MENQHKNLPNENWKVRFPSRSLAPWSICITRRQLVSSRALKILVVEGFSSQKHLMPQTQTWRKSMANSFFSPSTRLDSFNLVICSDIYVMARWLFVWCRASSNMFQAWLWYFFFHQIINIATAVRGEMRVAKATAGRGKMFRKALKQIKISTEKRKYLSDVIKMKSKGLRGQLERVRLVHASHPRWRLLLLRNSLTGRAAAKLRPCQKRFVAQTWNSDLFDGAENYFA